MKLIPKFAFFILLGVVLIHLSCKKEYSCENCNDKNKPPTAIAGGDQVITLPKDSVTLDGSASADPDGSITSYKWIKITGPSSSSILKADSSKTLVKALLMGVYEFELTVKDDGGLSAKDTVQIIVNDPSQPNRPPVANAGADQTITLPVNTVNLDGSGSTDPDNNITIYSWAKISGPSTFSIVNANAIQTQIINLIQGVYQLELKVTDALGLFSKDTMQVTVNPGLLTNVPPIANAGPDISVNYDLQTCSINPSSFNLNGGASIDPDGVIDAYLWTGPGTISDPNSANTQVSNISVGINEFILKVTDNNGATDMDTVLVNVVSLMNRPLVPAQLIPIGTLSQTRSGVAIGAAGNKIVFAGGWISPGNNFPSSTRTDIYDITTGTWTTAELSAGRFGSGVAVLGNKIFFGGGGVQQNNGWGAWQYGGLGSSAVDIYDASTNLWSKAQLSSPRSPTGASASSKIIFFGGDDMYPSSRVDIYDEVMNSWTNTLLSESRYINQAVTAGSKIFLAGGSSGLFGSGGSGISKQIDIFDASSSTWSIDSLSMERAVMGSISSNNKIYWGGGAIVSTDGTEYDVTSSVEIRDLLTNTTSFKCLSEPKFGLTALRKNNKIIFFGGYNNARFDIYDLTTDSWTIGVLPQNIHWPSIISYNNTIYLAGAEVNGNVSAQVWKLEF